MSVLVGHFVSSLRESGERDRRNSRGDHREGGKKENKNESEETEEIKNIPYLLLPAVRIAGLAPLLASIRRTSQ